MTRIPTPILLFYLSNKHFPTQITLSFHSQSSGSLCQGVHGIPSPSKAPTPTQSQTFRLLLLLPIALILRFCFFFFTEHRENSRGEQRRNRLPNHEDREEARDSDRRGVQRRRPWRASCQIGRRGRPYRSSTGSVELPQRVVDCRRCVSHWCAGELEKGIRFSVWLVRKCGKIREIEFVLFWADYAYVVDCWSWFQFHWVLVKFVLFIIFLINVYSSSSIWIMIQLLANV